jgi:hypothetical protein
MGEPPPPPPPPDVKKVLFIPNILEVDFDTYI